MVIVNFTSLAATIPPGLFDRQELQDILAVAEALIANHTADFIEAAIVDWEIALLWTVQREEPRDQAWYQRALLLICLRGLRGEIRPDFTWISAD